LTDDGELKNLSYFKIKRILLNETSEVNKILNGNTITEKAIVELEDGSFIFIYEIFF